MLFNSPVCEEISMSAWMASNSAGLIEDNFSLTASEVAQWPKKTLGIIG